MNKKEKIFRTFMTILFIGFIGIYISNKNGYNEYEKHKRVELTNKEIQKFEEDIKNNKDIDINDYIGNINEDYSNGISNMSVKFSNITSKYIKKGINDIFNIISKLMN